ncbi:MAG: bacillithiol biosynthesis deacetylase BshB1 [Bacteroidetes bacterium]|nr:bacillithiol biosynthesis deacetylase BshB1 [Bacteroidota bacterium]
MAKLDILVFAAHPDDAELGCGGMIISMLEQGYKVGIIDLTEGEMGSRGTVESRYKEADLASQIMGLTYRSNLKISDSIIENNRTNQVKIIEEIRKTTPDLCFIGAPNDRHPDHRKATRLCADAIFYSGLSKIETKDSDDKPQNPWRPHHVFHYMQDRPIEYHFIYDISDVWNTKKKAMAAFSTQFNVIENDHEPKTYISDPSFFEQLEARARYLGHLGGCTYGEAFAYHNLPAGIKSFDSFLQHKQKR